jgi:hypothetical protein
MRTSVAKLLGCCLLLLFAGAVTSDSPAPLSAGRPTEGAGQNPNVPGPGGPAANNASVILQAVKNTEQESQEALKVTYKDLDDNKDSFNKSQENQAETLTILRKSSH